MNKPNFFIVGAPKCGTTALCDYLSTHSQIFISPIKEPHHFSDDFQNSVALKDFNNYLQLFSKATNKHLAIGEASIWYLYSRVAIKNIYNYDKNSKLIVMLRNPVDMAYSLHSELLFNLDEDEEDFENAWNLQFERRNGNSIPINCRNSAMLQYKQICMLGEQVERLLKIFPQKQIKFILFDDFVKSTKDVYKDVLSFLNLQFDGKTNFLRINQNKTIKLPWLANFMQRPNIFIQLGKFFQQVTGIKRRFGVITFIQNINSIINTKNVKRKPLNSDFRKNLLKDFHEDINKLSHLTKIDLSNWFVIRK